MFIREKILVLLSILSFLVESEQQIDHFVLTLYWPNTYCKSRDFICKENVPQEFKISGLWPHMSDGETSPRISSHFLLEEEVQTWNFTKKLELIWPSLVLNKTNVKLWQKRWYFAGAYTDMTPENYFYTVIKYSKRYVNLREILEKSAGKTIIPSNKVRYDLNDIRKEVANVVGSSPRLHCHMTLNREYMLYGMSFCMDYHGVSFNCGNPFARCRKSGAVLIPTEKSA